MMNPLKLIIRYELKLLLRNRVFIFFACLSIGGIPLLQYFFQERIPLYHLKALSCSFPFVNAFLFNLLQSLAVVFTGGDFVRRARQCDSLEAIRPRPYSNWEYIAGKYMAVVLAFGLLNILAILPVLGFHACVSDSPFALWPYVFYAFTLTLPALLFIAGLTLWVNIVVRISFLALAVLLGFLGLNHLFLAEQGYGSMDFLATSLPNIFSAVTGHVGLDWYLWQRLAVGLMGLALMMFAVSAVRRKDNRRNMPRYLNTVALLMFAGGMMAGGYYYGTFRSDKQRRAHYISLYEAYQRSERVNVISQQMICRQAGNRIEVTDSLLLKNPGKYRLEEIVLYLNPGLQVTSIASDKGSLPFYRKGQVLVVQHALEAGAVCRTVICYSGCIDENICYLDIKDEVYEQTVWSNNLLRYGKQHALVSDAYTFLTPECLWYPVATPLIDPVRPWLSDHDFTDFRLMVAHDSSQVVISQGKARKNGNNTCFVNPQPLPGITLCMGPYHKRGYQVDGIDFEIYALKADSKFSTMLDGIPAGIQRGMKAVFEEMERKYGCGYPYRKLAVIELPVAFRTYLRDWKAGSEFVQPELLFQPEDWCKNTSYQPIGQYIKELKKIGIQQSDTAMVSNYMINFFRSQFGENWDEFSPMTFKGVLQGHRVVLETVKNQTSITPMFTDFVRKIRAEEFPCIDRLINQLYMDHQAWLKLFGGDVGITDDYNAVKYLKTGSLKQALQDSLAFPDMKYIFRLKSLFLEKYLYALVGAQNCQRFLQDISARYFFQHIPMEEFVSAFRQQFGLDLTGIFRKLYEESGLPVLQIQHIEQKLVKREESETVFVTFEVWNTGKTDGVVTCYIQNPENFSGFQEIESVIVRGGDCYRIAIPLESKTRNVLLHTNLAGNLPVKYEKYSGDQLPELAAIPEKVMPLNSCCFQIPENEIIVDNEDENFQIQEPPEGKKIFRGKKDSELPEYGEGVDFVTLNFSGWLKSVFTHAYGNSIRSFYGKATENSEGKALWKTDIPEEGLYEVYVYQLGLHSRYQNYDLAAYYYTLEQSDYKSDIVVGIDKGDRRNISIKDNTGFTDEFDMRMDRIQGNGWVPIGIYELVEGEVKLILHDRGAFPGQLIFADAVKWVKR